MLNKVLFESQDLGTKKKHKATGKWYDIDWY